MLEVDSLISTYLKYKDFVVLNFEEAKFVKVALNDTILEGANLKGAKLAGINLERANLRNACLVNADLSYSNITDGDLINVNLSKACLIKTKLNGARLIEAELTDTILTEAELVGADLRRAQLNRANLEEAKMIGAKLTNSDLKKAQLINADLRKANLFGANMEGANLMGTIFDECQVKWLGKRYNLLDTRTYIALSDEIISYKDYIVRKKQKFTKEIFCNYYKSAFYFEKLYPIICSYLNVINISYKQSDKIRFETFEYESEILEKLYKEIINYLYKIIDIEKVNLTECLADLDLIYSCIKMNTVIAEKNMKMKIGIKCDVDWFKKLKNSLNETYANFTVHVRK